MNATAETSDIPLSQRMSSVALNPIIAVMNRARALRAAGTRVCDFSVGEPDFDTPAHVQDAAIAAIRRGETRYTATDGTTLLKEAIQEKFRRENGLQYRVDQITAAAGAKQVIYNAFQATLDPGDEVIIPAPYWTSYPDVVRLGGGRPVIVACDRSSGYRLSPAALEQAITPRTKWLVLNSPSNPTGAVHSADELRALAEVLVRHPQVLVLSDDIYEHLIYGGQAFTSIAQVAPSLHARVLTVNGVSKTYAMTGWRIGYAGGPTPLIRAMAAIQSQATSNPCSISQAAAVEALLGPQKLVAERRADFERRRDVMVESLRHAPGLAFDVPQGAFYVYVDCSALIGRRTPQGTTITDDTALATYLLEQAHVATVQGSGFGFSPAIRLAYATTETDIRHGCAAIVAACNALH